MTFQRSCSTTPPRRDCSASFTKRGGLVEDAVKDLFTAHGVEFIKTRSTNQGQIASRFEILVAPGFVDFETRGTTEVVTRCSTSPRSPDSRHTRLTSHQ